MTIIGLTGSFGTGKTFVASVLKKLGAQIIDADKIAHEVIRKGTPAYKNMVRQFGKGILDRTGQIDRKKAAGIVFKNKKDVKKLNRMVHPAVIRIIKERIKKYGSAKAVVIDAPLLVEAGLAGIVDKLVVVASSRKKQIERCKSKFCMDKKEVAERIGNQMLLKEKIKLADFVIDNNGTKSETRAKVKKAWRKIWK